MTTKTRRSQSQVLAAMLEAEASLNPRNKRLTDEVSSEARVSSRSSAQVHAD